MLIERSFVHMKFVGRIIATYGVYIF
jgi:hypothetical protein